MEFNNRIDERGRFMGLSIEIDGKPGQADTHGYGAAYALNKMRELGETIFIDLGGVVEKPEFKYDIEVKENE